MHKKAAEDTRMGEEKLNRAADYVTEKVTEVKDTIAKTSTDWAADAKHKVEEATHHPHIKDYGKLVIIRRSDLLSTFY